MAKKKRYFAEKTVTDSEVASSKHANIFAQILIMKKIILLQIVIISIKHIYG